MPKPEPLPLSTVTMPGCASRTWCRCARQRSPSTYRVSGMGVSRAPFPSSPARHVDRERLVEQRVERQVPLAGILHGLAAGAGLEADQPDVRVVLVEGVGDPAQVVDVRAGGERVADHLP